MKSDQPLSVLVKNKTNEWESVAHEVISEDDLWTEWVCIRTQFILKYSIDQGKEQEAFSDELIDRLAETKAKLLDTQKPTLKIDETEIVLNAGKLMSGIGKNGKVSAALLQTKNGDANAEANGFNTLKIRVLSDASTELSSEFIGESFRIYFDDSQMVYASVEFHLQSFR